MKRLNRLFAILLVALLVTGCMKYNTQMSITAQGDVNLNLTVAFSNSVLDMMDEMGDETDGGSNTGSMAILDPEDIAEYEKLGFKAEEYSDSLWTGIKLSKTYKIEEASSPNPVTISIMDFMEENPSILFQSLGNDTYKGHFIVKAEDMQNASGGMNMEGMDQEQLDALYDSMDLSYSITLPSKPISHNADKVEGNTLTWNFKMEGVTDIQYEFSLKGSSADVISNSNGNSSSNATSNNTSTTSSDKKDNTTMWIIIGIAGAAVVLIIVVVVVVVSKKKKNSNAMMNVSPVGQMPQMTNVPMAPVQPQPMQPQVPVQPVQQPVAEPVVPSPVETAPVAPTTPVVEQPVAPTPEVPQDTTSDNQSNNVQ